jgi:hypothetical protein
MSPAPTTKPTRPRMTTTEIAQATLRLRRRLEDALSGGLYENDAERRFLQAMIDLLYCISASDSGSETIIDSVSKLTLKRRLRNVFSRSTSAWTNSYTHRRVCVPSPSEQV